MDYLTELLMEREKILTELLERTGDGGVGKWGLRITKSKGCTQYYAYEKGTSGKSCGSYIKKADGERVKQIAGDEYHRKLHRKIDKQLRAIRACIKSGDMKDLSDIYDRMCGERKKLVEPLVLPDDEYVAEWLAEEYEKKPFETGTVEIYTAKGERVRSKSEKIIADQLASYGIPYKYECPLKLGGMIIHPDFTILNVRQRKQLYMEHFGMMDDREYAQRAVKRVEDFEKNGIMQGVELVITFETRNVPLNTRVLDMIIKEFFL